MNEDRSKYNPSRFLVGLPVLLGDAVAATTTLVERLHALAAERAFSPLATLVPGAAHVRRAHHAVAATVYAAIRATARGVGEAGSAGLAAAAAAGLFTPQGAAERRLLHGVGILNGLYGDTVRRRHARLDLGMTLHYADDCDPVTPAALAQHAPHLTNRLCLFVHGVCCTEQAWRLYTGPGELPMSARLCAELGLTPFYLRYNSGRHISENGRDLARVLEELVAAYPRPVTEIVLVGHSMGGLVARSAAHYAQEQEAAWLRHLRRIVYLGTPQRGAPLEQVAHGLACLLGAIPAPGTLAPAAVLKGRSAGLQDLRYGYTLDEEWQGQAAGAWAQNRRHARPVAGMEHIAVAATVARDPAHWRGRLLGDLLVRPASAGAPPAGRVHTLGRLHHLHLLNHPEVYAVLRRIFAELPTESRAAVGG
ncbi:MAG: alpha/beta fold hydrolase [Caldilineaceae bacterium]|nr:alpha/beta fold hydrolase [Caldilineaceae bacterium]